MPLKLLLGSLKGEHSEDLDIDSRIILKWTLGTSFVRAWTGFMWLRMGPAAGSCEHGNEPFLFHKRREFS
jgi:hypothetical protein